MPRLPNDHPEDEVDSPPVQEEPIALPRIGAGTRDDLRQPDALAELVHDMKSPLAIITLETRLLEERLGAGVSQAIQRSLQRVALNAGYLDRLIMDLLDLGSLDADAFELDREPVDLAHVVGDALERAVSTLDRGRVQLEVFDHPTLSADANRIERVISNLVGNALKYSPQSSTVTVRLHVRASRARLDVIDGGPGLDAEQARTVFERYRRAATSRGRAGYGLGLYVSRHIIEAHGGTIGVQSTPGKGARFWFELPIS